MADGVSSTTIQSSYEKYKEYFATDTSTSLDQTDFLTLMVEQLKNQDFNNPTDNTEFIAQMAQFSTLQSQQQMTYYTQATYATSLVGKTVVVASTDSSGNYVTEEGAVTSLKFANNDFTFVVNGNTYSAKNIMEVKNAGSSGGTTDKTVSATEDVNLEKVEGLSSIITGTPKVTLKLNGTQSTPIILSLAEGTKDEVLGYEVGTGSSILAINLENFEDITSTSDLVERINKVISDEISNPTDPSNPIMTSENYTAGEISIQVDTSGVTRTDKTTLTEDDLSNIDEAAAKTITGITTGIILK